MALLDAAPQSGLKAEVERLFVRKRLIAVAVPGLLLLYLTYVFFAFDIPGLAQRARIDNGLTLIRDSYSYKTLVTRDNRTAQLVVAIEGERKGTYKPGQGPDWVHRAGDTTRIDLARGAEVVYTPDAVTYAVPDYGTITVRIVGRRIETVLPPGPVPAWINASHTRLTVTAPEGRLTVTRARTEVARYFFGWEMFFFTLDSPYYGHSVPDLLGHLLGGQRIDPARANLAGMWHDFWHNPVWRHHDVAWAIFETVLMAFLGTLGAAVLALPLAFLAARNFTPTRGLRFGVRRVFDFLRGVDGLIWTIILSRAFGPGPLTGSLAILLTDTGSFGKMFSEALENVEHRQIEGIRSTGANAASALPLRGDPAGDAGAGEPGALFPRIEHAQRHHHRRHRRRRDRPAADPGDQYPAQLGRGGLLHRADPWHGDGDGLAVGDPAASAHQGQVTAQGLWKMPPAGISGSG